MYSEFLLKRTDLRFDRNHKPLNVSLAKKKQLTHLSMLTWSVRLHIPRQAGPHHSSAGSHNSEAKSRLFYVLLFLLMVLSDIFYSYERHRSTYCRRCGGGLGG